MTSSRWWWWWCCCCYAVILPAILTVTEAVTSEYRLRRLSGFPLAEMRLLVQDQVVREGKVHFTDVITMEISLHYSIRDSNDLFVEECTANDKAIVKYGCSLDAALFPNFRYEPPGRVHTSFSAFREVAKRHANVVHFVCKVRVCLGQCSRTQCGASSSKNMIPHTPVRGDPERGDNSPGIESSSRIPNMPTLTYQITGATIEVADSPDKDNKISSSAIELIIASVVLLVLVSVTAVLVILFKKQEIRERKEESGSSPLGDLSMSRDALVS